MQVKKSAQTERGGNRRNIPSKRLLDFNRLSAGRDLRFLINYIAISSFSNNESAASQEVAGIFSKSYVFIA